MVYGLGFRYSLSFGQGFMVYGLGFMVWVFLILWPRVYGSGFRVEAAVPPVDQVFLILYT
jgi:hypothetical protein